MAIEDYEHDSLRCTRCSYCKWIPWESMRHPDYMQGCPSVAKYLFHAYAAGGKFNLSLAFQKGRLDYTDGFLDAVFKCQMDGSCDISCKDGSGYRAPAEHAGTENQMRSGWSGRSCPHARR